MSQTTGTPTARPAGRYGPQVTPRRRLLQRLGAAVAALAVTAVAVWVGHNLVTDPLQWKDLGYVVLDDDTVQVRFEVTMDAGDTATCQVHALSDQYTEVGFKSVEVPAASTRSQQVTVEMHTVGRAVTGSLVGCDLDG